MAGKSRTVYVTKFDGSRQPFERWKVVRTCTRMGASQKAANDIVDHIEDNIRDGIRTKEILRMVFKYMRKYKPEIGHQIDLREAISLLRPKPDFEKFVALLLEEQGYSVETNRLVEGECMTHEIDAIAVKGGETIYVEVKHHAAPHTTTGAEVVLETYARLLDMQAGRRLGRNGVDFTRAALVCNTRLSEPAERYADRKNIMHVGWDSPEGRGLETIVAERRLHPITFLKGMDRTAAARLADHGIILLRQLAAADAEKLSEKVGVPKAKLVKLAANAKEILDGLK